MKYWSAKHNLNFLKDFTKFQLKKKLEKIGFLNPKIYVVDHHLAHAASAIFTSGFEKNLCITLDGVGDGLSGTINIFENGEIKKISEMKERIQSVYFMKK